MRLKNEIRIQTQIFQFPLTLPESKLYPLAKKIYNRILYLYNTIKHDHILSRGLLLIDSIKSEMPIIEILDLFY